VSQANFHPRAAWRAPAEFFSVFVLLCGAALFASVANASSLTISGTPPKTVAAGSTYSFTPSVVDSLSGRTLSFAIVGKPAWATFSSSTGKLSGTPGASSVGKFSDIEIEVNDGVNAAVLSSFSITVQTSSSGSGGSSPTPPAGGSGAVTIGGTPPATVNAGSTYSFTPTTTNPNGRTLSFAIIDKPSWATFSSSTGKLTGTPSASNVGKFSDIEIAVNNGLTSAVLPSFAVTVQSGGGTTTDSVTISGTPSKTVTEGKTYSFQPSAKDSSGKTLSYSVSNKPSWATFSIASGLLSGTPTTTGTYSNIVVSASDGTASGALPAFSIAVVAPTPVSGTGSATLAWTDPTKNTNGTSLTNLAGVHLFYGQSQTSMTNEITVPSTSENTYTVSGLSAGTWYFAATAYTSSGAQSALSAVGTKTIQ
jgi:Putative Ig domain